MLQSTFHTGDTPLITTQMIIGSGSKRSRATLHSKGMWNWVKEWRARKHRYACYAHTQVQIYKHKRMCITYMYSGMRVCVCAYVCAYVYYRQHGDIGRGISCTVTTTAEHGRKHNNSNSCQDSCQERCQNCCWSHCQQHLPGGMDK